MMRIPAMPAAIAAGVLMGALGAAPVRAGTGQLDATFGGTGVVAENFGGLDLSLVAAVVAQPDGKVVAFGSFFDPIGSLRGLAAVRYLGNGSLDATFGTGGRVRLDFPSATNWGLADALLLDDGRFIVSADITGNGAFPDFDGLVFRLEADGSLDTTFGTDGFTVLPLFADGQVRRQPDGKLIVGGLVVDLLLGTGVGTARLDADGALDPTWGGDGIVHTNYPAFISGGTALQADGKIVRTGTNQTNALIVRYEADGDPDPTFGAGGTVMETSAYGAGPVVVQGDGKIVTMLDGVGDTLLRLARYQSDGSPDPGFGDGGQVTHAVGLTERYARALVLDADAQFVVANTRALIPPDNFFGDGQIPATVTRIRSDGRLDPRFGFGGYGVGPDDLEAASVAVQADGKILVGGALRGAPYRFAVARYEAACPALPDTDGDGTGDACDPCTNGSLPDKAKLQFRGLGAPAGDDSMRLVGTFTLPDAGALVPTATGLRLRVANGTGDVLVDAFIPPGAYDPARRVGWTTSGSGIKTSYSSTSELAAPLFAVRSAKIKALPLPNVVKLKVQAVDTSYAIDAGDLPLHATLVYDPPFAHGGKCIELDYAGPPPAPACTVNSTATTVRCR